MKIQNTCSPRKCPTCRASTTIRNTNNLAIWRGCGSPNDNCCMQSLLQTGLKTSDQVTIYPVKGSSKGSCPSRKKE